MENIYRFRIVDSHRNMTRKTEDAMTHFFSDIDGTDMETARGKVHFCEWYEKVTAVKWLEVVAWSGGDIVGYLRCLRNPDSAIEWFIGDVRVREEHRRRGIASKMYEKLISAVMEYEQAECLIASVHPDNIPSVSFHRKMEFYNMGRPCEFPNIFFNESETEYRRGLYQYLPVPDVPESMLMLPLWMKYVKEKEGAVDGKKGKQSFQEVLRRAAAGEVVLEAIWCGSRLVGLRYDREDWFVEDGFRWHREK